MADEFQALVLGALNVLLAQAAKEASRSDSALMYYQDWLRRVRELEKING